MIDLKILCDNCDKDLSTTGNVIDYRLVLKDERIHPSGNLVTQKMVYPTFKDGEKHFCGLGCLKMWIHKQ